jgi:hypothetical protein
MARKRNDLNASAGAAAPPRRTAQRRVRRAAPVAVAATATESQPAAVAPVCEPSGVEIAQLAYSYWEARGCRGGSPEQDWLRAEQELRSRSAEATAA